MMNMPTSDSNVEAVSTPTRSRIGLALAGGGSLGIVYEIGALVALSEALEGIAFNDLHVYVGVSAGAVVASALANGFTPAELCQIVVLNQSTAFPLNPEQFLRPSLRLYAQGLVALPSRLWETAQTFLSKPHELSPFSALSYLIGALPPGLWDNDGIDHALRQLYGSRGCTNDFRQLKRPLLVMAMNLDTGEIVRFGGKGYDQVPISKAVQASTAVPGLFPPVKIEEHYYVDGAVQKTVHASTALEAGADLVLCINPLVPFNPRLADPQCGRSLQTIVDGGLPVVIAQTVRTLLHSRMKASMARYASEYPGQDILVFEPNQGDADMFFAELFSFSHRRRVCEHAYQTTRRDLLARQTRLEPLLTRYGISLRTDFLRDPHRHFDSFLSLPSGVTRTAQRRNPVTTDLSDTLDRLEKWLTEQRAPHNIHYETPIHLRTRAGLHATVPAKPCSEQNPGLDQTGERSAPSRSRPNVWLVPH
jgi:predicted acylesterase/phospholipase RssA